jgi:hypothetical protein
MTDGTRVLRTLALPILVAVILLFAIPKTCGGVLQKGLTRRQATAASTTGGDLSIQSSTPDPNAKHSVTFPDGLDEARVRYLVEIAPQFAEPHRIKVPRTGQDADRDPLVASLLRDGTFATQPDGTLAPTRDATLHLAGLQEEPTGWTLPIAQRKFDGVTNIADLGGGAWRITFRWNWEPNALGRDVPDLSRTHDSDVDVAGSPGSWAASNFSRMDR